MKRTVPWPPVCARCKRLPSLPPIAGGNPLGLCASCILPKKERVK